MDKYLDRYIGKYRVKAHTDLNTNDFPRDYNGNIDQSFGDFYIDCYNQIEIRHVPPEKYKRDHMLMAYIPNKVKGTNIIKKILDNNSISYKNNTEEIESALNQIEGFSNADITDEETTFMFQPEKLEYVFKFIKVKTNGANITPLSTKNLPKKVNIIPDHEIDRYNQIMESLRFSKKEEKAQLIMAINRNFKSFLPKNYKTDMKQKKMDFKNYIYSIGKWENYLSKLIEQAK